MTFTSATFLFFFVFAYLTLLILKRTARLEISQHFLLLASLVSYSFFYYPYLAILLFSVFVAYFFSRAIDASESEGRRRGLLVCGVLLNVLLLGIFKYTDFIIQTLNDLLAYGNFTAHFDPPGILLPIGISFFTFQSISYLVDVYRRDFRPLKKPAGLTLYISFFPQLVAGPIVRARQFIPQLRRAPFIKPIFFNWGMFLIILGVFKKTVIADNLALNVDYFFSLGSYEDIHSFTAWYCMICYAVQIYTDFSGYSDIAVGLGYLLGFRLPINFYYPYISLGFGDFWRRWNITLSEWIRDYIYIPLGGSRRSRLRTIGNLVLTMGAVGLWHGASWGFVLWGLLHGLFLVIDQVVLRRLLGLPAMKKRVLYLLSSFGVRALTFACVVFAWVPFRASTLDQAAGIARAMFTSFNPALLLNGLYLTFSGYVLIIAAMHGVVLLAKGDRRFRRFRWPIYFVGALLMLTTIVYNRMPGNNAFIYFQF